MTFVNFSWVNLFFHGKTILFRTILKMFVSNEQMFGLKRSLRKNNKTCLNSGGEFPHKDRPCPAKNKTCTKYGKHFAKQCRSGNRNKEGAKNLMTVERNCDQ